MLFYHVTTTGCTNGDATDSRTKVSFAPHSILLVLRTEEARLRMMTMSLLASVSLFALVASSRPVLVDSDP